MSQEMHDANLKVLDDDDEIKLAFEWFGPRNKDVLRIKQRIIGSVLNDADKLRGGLRDTHSVKCKSSRRSRHSLSSVTSYIHTYIHTLLARPHGAFQSQFYITKL